MIIAVSLTVISIAIFTIISILFNQAELNELHERTLITSFLCILIAKVHVDKLK